MRLSNDGWDIVAVNAIRGYTIEWVEPNHFVLSRREKLYEASSLDDNFTRLGSFPCGFWKKKVTRLRLFQRLFRHMYYNVVKLSERSLFLTFGRSIGLYSGGNIQLLKGLVRPCRVLRSGCAVDEDGVVFLGEYLDNKERNPIHIYKYTKESIQLEVIYTFPSNSIRHVHGIYHDPHTKDLWCATGDNGSECRILRTADSFRHLEVVGEGDESWRCVGLLFSDTAVCYATDSEFQQNKIYRIDRKTGKRNELTNIEGLVYYSCALGNDLFFGVTAELRPGQKGSVHKGRAASLWHVSADGKTSRIFSSEKDHLSAKYFMPGTLHFPQGPGLSTMFYFHCVGLKGDDNLTYRVRKR